MSWQHIHPYLWGGVDRGDPAHVRFAGDLDLATTPHAERFFDECVAECSGEIVLDLSRIGFMDARGFAFLAQTQTCSGLRSRVVSLRSPSRAVARVLELGLTPHFELAPPVLPANDRHHRDIVAILEQTVERAIALDGAQRGSAQRVDSGGALQLVAAPGFSRAFRSYFDRVHDESGASCGVALATQRVVPVCDVTESSIFVDTPSLDVMLDDDARACVSIPIVVDGVLVGMVSTHHDRPRHWRAEDVRALQTLAASAARELRSSIAA